MTIENKQIVITTDNRLSGDPMSIENHIDEMVKAIDSLSPSILIETRITVGDPPKQLQPKPVPPNLLSQLLELDKDDDGDLI